MPTKFAESDRENTWTYRLGSQEKVKGAILAAGLGKRLDPLTTRYLPKPMFPLGGKIPMVELWVRRFSDSGIRDISMNLCVLSDTIKDHFNDGAKFGSNITYVDEEKPSGTFGGICKQVLGKKAKRLPGEKNLPSGPFRGTTVIAPSGDIVMNLGQDLLQKMYEIHKQVGAALTMILVPVPWERRKDFGTAVMSKPEAGNGSFPRTGRIDQFLEKDENSPSNLNNASVYMIEMELIRYLDGFRTEARLDVPEPFYDFGKHVFPALLKKLPYAAVPKDMPFWGIEYHGKWFDVGQKRDYLNVNKCLLDGELDVALPYEKLPWGYLGTDVAIDFNKVTIIPPVIIGNHCTIEAGATLGPYAVIGDGWVVDRDTTIRNSILWEMYPAYDEFGKKISRRQLRLIDRHEVRRGVTIDQSIVTGGEIDSDIREQTVEVSEDGELRLLSIDYVPEGLRA